MIGFWKQDGQLFAHVVRKDNNSLYLSSVPIGDLRFRIKPIIFTDKKEVDRFCRTNGFNQISKDVVLMPVEVTDELI